MGWGGGGGARPTFKAREKRPGDEVVPIGDVIQHFNNYRLQGYRYITSSKFLLQQKFLSLYESLTINFYKVIFGHPRRFFGVRRHNA